MFNSCKSCKILMFKFFSNLSSIELFQHKKFLFSFKAFSFSHPACLSCTICVSELLCAVIWKQITQCRFNMETKSFLYVFLLASDLHIRCLPFLLFSFLNKEKNFHEFLFYANFSEWKLYCCKTMNSIVRYIVWHFSSGH